MLAGLNRLEGGGDVSYGGYHAADSGRCRRCSGVPDPQGDRCIGSNVVGFAGPGEHDDRAVVGVRSMNPRGSWRG